MRFVAKAALLSLISLAACDSPTANEDVGVIFDMIQSATQPLPIELGEVLPGCMDSLLAASIVLESDNDAVSYTGKVRNCDGVRTQLIETGEGDYTQNGSELTFTWEFDNDPVIAFVTERAVLEGSTLTFRQRVFTEEDPDGTTFYDYAVYRRR